ncbi:response regulator [Pelagibius sp.]|uniref:response regulator n=1 Tax=Pelagibius sp. TaxID=1931238 RepID=UPI003B511C05
MIPQAASTPRRALRGRHPNRILVVDDDPVVQVLLRETLLAEGYDVSGAKSSEEAEQRLRQSPWDLVILDRRLPDADGLLLLQTVKEKSGCPVIILSVMDDQHDRTLGLGLGAQDYVAKPFSASEILLRIRNLLVARDVSLLPGRTQEIEHGPFRLVQTTRRLTADGTTHQLTAAEARLLAVFLTHPGEVLDRTSLTRSICQREWSHNDRSIDVLVARLRKRIETDPKSPEWIVTVHGAGYLFSAEIPCRPC